MNPWVGLLGVAPGLLGVACREVAHQVGGVAPAWRHHDHRQALQAAGALLLVGVGAVACHGLPCPGEEVVASPLAALGQCVPLSGAGLAPQGACSSR